MKCLSIQQPWAQYIAAGIKDVENRSWGLKTFPQRVLIHTGKKKQLNSIDNLPLCWLLPIENAENLGIVPLPEKMPTGAIIGVVDIVGCTIEAQNDSVWSQFNDDPEHPMYNLMLANAKLFKEPILNVKGKQGIFEYADISEDNLPECVEIPTIHRTKDELFIPLHPEVIQKIIESTEEEIAFGHNLLEDNFDIFAVFDGEEAKPISTSYITFFSADEKIRLKVIQSDIIQMTDDEDNPIEFTTPQGDELYWVRIGYKLVKE